MRAPFVIAALLWPHTPGKVLVRSSAPGGTIAPVQHEVLDEPKIVEWAARLAPLTIKNIHTQEEARVLFYDPRGAIDPEAERTFARLSGPIATRTMQLAVRAAYHFGSPAIVIVSGYRPKTGKRDNPHTMGEALDFKLEGVKTRDLAPFLRRSARVGVGIYVHPRTQYVHLDVRPRSFHWADGSPPGKDWREQAITCWGCEAKDAAYDPVDDLPL
jgi:uncharacterized protein YcbK (DUF882 family)